jgi:hypothetical protein
MQLAVITGFEFLFLHGLGGLSWPDIFAGQEVACLGCTDRHMGGSALGFLTLTFDNLSGVHICQVPRIAVYYIKQYNTLFDMETKLI